MENTISNDEPIVISPPAVFGRFPSATAATPSSISMPEPEPIIESQEPVNLEANSSQEIDESSFRFSEAVRVPKNPDIEYSLAGRDSKHTSVSPPSLCYFYPFDEFSVGLVTGYHQSKFSRAAKESKTVHMVDAIQTLLPNTVNIRKFTIPDFYWLLYYIRLTQYTKSNLTHVGVCLDEKHHARIRSGELKESTLKTVDTLTTTSLSETEFDPRVLDIIPYSDWKRIDDLGLRFCPGTVEDLLYVEDKLIGLPNYEEIEFLCDLASCIQPKSGDVSLADRIRIVEQMVPDDLEIITLYKELTVSYGVEETYRFKCKECGAVNESVISITASSFL